MWQPLLCALLAPVYTVVVRVFDGLLVGADAVSLLQTRMRRGRVRVGLCSVPASGCESPRAPSWATRNKFTAFGQSEIFRIGRSE